MVGLPIVTWERLIIWLITGLVVYFAYGRFRTRAIRAGAWEATAP
jgi:APA family basic amino acid/polyamine antiporter